MSLRSLICVVWIIATTATSGLAHPLSPTLLEVIERDSSPGTYDVRWKTSVLRVPGSDLQPDIPQRCTQVREMTAREEGDSLYREWAIDCGDTGIVGAAVGFSGLGPAKIDGLVRVQLANGHTVRGVVRPTAPTLTITKAQGRFDVFVSYVRLGFEHILSGLDHLLFVFGLLLLVDNRRLLIQTITSFTFGHSVTLSLAALGVVSYPTRPIELVIALSVFFLAVELSRGGKGRHSMMRRWPWAVAMGFGLLHGLGFAGALAQVGLPAHEIPLALFSFNVGIELGQLLFVAVVFVARALSRPLTNNLPRWAEMIPLYVMGSLAAFWCFERLAEVLA